MLLSGEPGETIWPQDHDQFSLAGSRGVWPTTSPSPFFSLEVAKYSRQNKDDKCREKPALERRRDCVIAKMNTDRRRKSVFGKCGIMRRCVSWVAVHGSQCGSLEVSENSEALNEGKGS